MTAPGSGVPGLASFKPKGPRPGTAAGDSDLPALRRVLIDGVRDYVDRAPRSQQTTMGPSQAAHPCARHLVYSFSKVPELKRYIDPWPSFLGTAGHDHLDKAYAAVNRFLAAAGKDPEWLLDERVWTGFESVPHGKLDAHHLPTHTTVDFKILGDTQHAKAVKHRSESSYWKEGVGEGGQYVGQLQVYGYGVQRRGVRVDKVALAVFGRAKPLKDLVVRAWDFDEDMALWILRRTDAARLLGLAGVDPRAVPFTKTAKGCGYCPYKGNEDDGYCEES